MFATPILYRMSLYLNTDFKKTRKLDVDYEKSVRLCGFVSLGLLKISETRFVTFV